MDTDNIGDDFRARIIAAFDLTDDDVAAFEATPQLRDYQMSRTEHDAREYEWRAWARAYTDGFNAGVWAALEAQHKNH